LPDTRTQLNIKVDAKTHWLTNLAARYCGVTLAEFVESSIVRAISREAMLSDEPRVMEPTEPSVPLFHESLWSDDEATRLFNVATLAHALLIDAQRKTWAEITARIAADGAKLNLKTVREYYEQMKESE
jgi:uncharacterized protein (DUF1778 family)